MGVIPQRPVMLVLPQGHVLKYVDCEVTIGNFKIKQNIGLLFDTGRAWGTRPRMTQLDASVSTKVLPYFERLCADFSTRMWRFSPSFEDGIDDFVAEATVFSRCSFSPAAQAFAVATAGSSNPRDLPSSVRRLLTPFYNNFKTRFDRKSPMTLSERLPREKCQLRVLLRQ